MPLPAPRIYLGLDRPNRFDFSRVVRRPRGRPERVLIAYPTFCKMEVWRRINGFWLETLGTQPHYIVDSGAFTAMTQGITIREEDYLAWLREGARHFPIDYAFPLDVIGDAEASKAAWVRAQAALPEVRVCPVYHYGEPASYLDDYTRECPMVAYGGIALRRETKTARSPCHAWFRQRVGPDIYTHALGVFVWEILRTGLYDAYDATTWKAGAMFGALPLWNDREGRLQPQTSHERSAPSSKAHRFQVLPDYGLRTTDLPGLHTNERIALGYESARRMEDFLLRLGTHPRTPPGPPHPGPALQAP